MINNKKIEIKYIHIAYEDFSLENFINIIMNNFKLNTTYSILLKISSNNNLLFKMCGPQIGIVIKNEHDLDFYSKLYNLILTRIEITVDNYNYFDTVEGLEILYSVINPQKELTLKNIDKYSLKQQMINQGEVRKIFNQNLLPLTIDTSYYGFNILSEERQNLIKLINSNVILTNNEKDFIINDSDLIFKNTSPNKKKDFIIVSKKLDDNNFLRYIFDLNTGIYINKIKDTVYNNIDNNKILFDRNIGNITLTIEDQKLIKYKVVNKLHPIKAVKNSITDRNINIGTFDLETFIDMNGLAKVYALGYFSSIDDSPKLYYLTDDPNLDSSKLLLKCIDDMLVNKYNNFIFYVHNLGHYDIVFMYNIILKTNLEKGFDYYILNTTMRDKTIIKLEIKIKVYSNTKENKHRYIKISFVDSLNLLNLSLDKLTREFNIDIRKGNFPHRFVNRNTLNYIGYKPDYHFYDNLNINDYNNIPNNNWNLKSECLNYLHKDIIGLYEVINEFSRLIYIYFNELSTNALTITRLALNIFKNKYYKNPCIPSINKLYLFNFIKEGYFGGITDVYKPYGQNLIYLDVNSLYPYAALNPMPGTDCYFIESFEDKGLDLDNLFGFFYARVKTNNLYIGLLPIHKDNRLICPNGVFYGVWSSEELKFAKSKGYEITVFKGYQFNKVNNIFDDYVNDLFDKKKNSTGFLRLIYKSLLNNFLGRFGLNIIKPITQTVNKEKRDFICSTRIVHTHTILNDDKFLITYSPIISKEICMEHGLDFIKVLEKESKKNIENNLDLFKDVSIATAAFVTSYARIFINKCKLEILENGGSIFYSDTDSIVLNKDALNPNWIGDNIGQFKLEYDIKEAYFISNKTYCLILNNGETIIKTKGIINNSLTVEHFKSMYWYNSNVTATKFHTITNYQNASVLIKKKDVVLNYDSFTKREKIYNNEGIWIDTKPLNYNDTNTKY
uniref:Probable DNA polymerase n=1 Tax=Trametes versicolor TaxID=5325 RepID=A0A7S8WUZ5_TRAVE|nr:DNA polymerase [Trametes versicolor]QPF23613.1 DNA polymerase [Trametes versicolor]